jgi:hypothetical protein
MANKRQRIVFPRKVLLVEIERHCADTHCNARTRIGLTKEEARLYDGFECEVCERWHDDGLTERDIPDWWEELIITDLDALRARELSADMPDTNEAGGAGTDGGVVARLSEAWQSKERRDSGAGERSNAKDAPDDGGDV